MKHIKIVNNIDDAKNLVAKSLIYDNIHKQNINWLQQPDQGESFSVNEDIDGNLIADIFKISITYHNINSSLTYDLGFGDDGYILKVILNGREIDKSTIFNFVFDNDGDNVLDIYINKDPNEENSFIYWNDVSPEIDPVTVHINKYISNIPKLYTNIKDVICDAPIIKIEEGIFYSANIESFKCDGIIEYIGDNGFKACKNFKSIELKNGLQYIGNSAFDNSGLTGELTLPDSIKYIGSGAFNRCSGLTQLTLSNNLTTIKDGTFYNCSGLTGELTLPNSLKSIGNGAFTGCSGLTELTLPNSLKSIGDGTFGGCSGLTQLTLSNSLTSIGSGAFSGSGLTGELTLPDSLTSIGNTAFAGCTNVTIHVPETIETIGYAAFEGVKKVILKNYTRFDNWQSWYATEIVEE